MKKNQLLTILSFMLALGLPMPVLLFVDPVVEESSVENSKSLKPSKTLNKNSKLPATPEISAKNPDSSKSSETLPEASPSPSNIIKTEEELLDALKNPNLPELILVSDIIVLNNLEINRNVTINLAGYKIASLKPGARVIDVKNGQVIIAGPGSIVANGDGASAVRIKGATTSGNSNYASITIEAGVTLYSPNYYGLFITPNFQAAYGVKIELKGAIIARDGICINGSIQGDGDNIPQIFIQPGAKITVDESEGVALYASGHGKWQIDSAQILAATPLYARSGIFEFTNTQMTATGSSSSVDAHEIGFGNVFQLDREQTLRPLQLTINGGEYLSQQEYTIVKQNPSSDTVEPSLICHLKSGNFLGHQGNFYGFAPAEIGTNGLTIESGTFNTNIRQFLQPNQAIEYDSSHGHYRVIDAATIASRNATNRLAATKSDLESMVEQANLYLDPSYAGDELGELQPTYDKAAQNLRRALKTVKPILNDSESDSLDHHQSSIRKLKRALSEVQSIEDELRTDLHSNLAAAHAIDPLDYSRYSYNLLMESVEQAEHLLENPSATMKDLYSIYCDVDLNLELLDDPENETDRILPLPPLALPETIAAPAPDLAADLESEVVESDLNSDSDLDSSEQLFFTTILGAFAAANTDPDSPIIIPAEADYSTTVEEMIPVPSAPDPALLNARQSLRSLLNGISVLNPEDYTPESYAGLAQVASYAGALLSNENDNMTVEMLGAAFSRVNFAYESLVKKPHDPASLADEAASENLRSVLGAVHNLTINDYDMNMAEQFGELQVAIAKAEALLLRHAGISEIINAMDEITAATTGIKTSQPLVQPTQPVVQPVQPNFAVQPQSVSQPSLQFTPAAQTQPESTIHAQPEQTPAQLSVDWTTLREAISDISKLNESDYTADSYQYLLQQLERAKAILNNTDLTQAQIDDISFELNLAMLNLEHLDLSTAPISQQTPQTIIGQTSDPTNQGLNPVETQVLNQATSQTLDQPQTQSTDQSSAIISSANLDNISKSAITELDPGVTPSLLMSMMAGAYAGLATYRKSRLEAKRRKHLRSLVS